MYLNSINAFILLNLKKKWGSYVLYKSIISDTSTSNIRTNFYPQLPHMLCVHMLCWCVHAWYVSPIYLWGDVPILVKGLQSTAENCPPLLQQRQQLILQLVTLCMWVKVSTQQGWGKGGGYSSCAYCTSQLHCLNSTTQAFLTVSTVWFWWMDWRNSTAGSCPGGPVHHDDTPWTILTKATREFG